MEEATRLALQKLELRLTRLEYATGLGPISERDLKRYERRKFEGLNHDPHMEVPE